MPPKRKKADGTEIEQQDHDAALDHTAPEEAKKPGFFDIIGAFLKFIFSILFGKQGDERDDESVNDPNAAPLTTAEKTAIGTKLIAAGMAQKWDAYKTAHKGETVELRSPVLGNATVSSGFGHRHAPKAGASTYHKGVDLVAPQGDDKILAAADGIVIFADRFGNSGNTLVIGHADGSTTIYRHLKSLNELPALGQEVAQGQRVATMGNTGNSTGKHLHFEYHDPSGTARTPDIHGASLAKGATVKGGANQYAALTDPASHRTLPSADATADGIAHTPHAGPSTTRTRG